MNFTEFSSALVQSLGWTLLHSLWQGAVIFATLVILLFFLKKKTSELRYASCCISLLLLAVWMIFTFWSYLPDNVAQPQTTQLKTDEWNKTSVEEWASFSTPAAWRQSIQQKTGLFINMYADHLVSVWLLGAFFFGFRWLASAYLTYELRRTKTIKVPANWQKITRQLAKKLGVQRPVVLLESAKVEVPMIIGHFKPVILLPLGLLSGLNPQQIEAILIHELAHIRRYDFLINLWLSSLEILLFYHPVFWWISNRIMQEREQCCDDVAIAICGNARLYARTLLLMEEKRQQNTLAMAYQGKKHQLLNRIKRICLSSPDTSRREFGKAELALGLLLILAVATWAQIPAESIITPKQTTPKAVLTSTLPQRNLPDTILLAEISSMASRLSFFAELAKDGLVQTSDKNLKFVAQEGKVTVNGRELSNQDADKYLKLASSFGFEVPKDGKQLILVLARVKPKKDKKARKSSDKKALKKGKKQRETTLALSVPYESSSKKKKKKKKHPKVTKAQEIQLQSILDSGAEAYGFQGDFWTEKRVSRVIMESFNIKLSAKKCKKILKKLNFSLKS